MSVFGAGPKCRGWRSRNTVVQGAYGGNTQCSDKGQTLFPFFLFFNFTCYHFGFCWPALLMWLYQRAIAHCVLMHFVYKLT